MGVKERQIYRLIAKFRKGGRTIDSLQDRRGKATSVNKKQKKIRARVKELKREEKDYSNPHIAHKVKKEWRRKYDQNISLSGSTVRRILLEEEGLYTPARKRFKPAVRFEMGRFGELVQWDTTESSEWFWFGHGRTFKLILQQDDATRKILAARIALSDDTYTNMLVARETVESYGIPGIFYVDNDSKFKYSEKSSRHYSYRVSAEQVVTQMEFALQKLNCVLSSHQPGNARAKGKIEKHFDFFQSWFVVEHRGIELPKNDKEALETLNKLLQKEWVEWFNKREHHGLNGESPNQKAERLEGEDRVDFQPVPKDINLDDVFCLVAKRTLNKDNTFSYEGKTYHLQPRKAVSYKAYGKLTLHIHPGKKIRVFYQDNFVAELPWKN